MKERLEDLQLFNNYNNLWDNMLKKILFLSLLITNSTFGMRVEKFGKVSNEELQELIKEVFVLNKDSIQNNIIYVLEKKNSLLKSNPFFGKFMENNLEIFYQSVGELFKQKYHKYVLTSELKNVVFKADKEASKILLYAGADANTTEKNYGSDFVTVKENTHLNEELRDIWKLIIKLESGNK